MSKYTLAELRNLQEDDDLDLSACGIHDFPNSIVQLPRLTRLDLSSNSISFLPPTFSKMTKLVRLDFGNNQLHHLPDDIGLLVNLQHLNLYNNKLEDLPLSFAKLKALKWLDLKKNPLNPKLAEIAGKCATDAECKTAAKQVVDVYMGGRKKEFDAAKAAEAKVRAKVQKAQEEEKIRKYQEKKKRNEELKTEQEKEQKQREAARAAAQQHTQAQKAKNVKEPSPATNKRRGEKEIQQPRPRGFFGKLFGFVWTCVFYLSVALVTSSTIAIGLDCKGYGTPIPGTAPLCKDFQLLGSFKQPSAKFVQNAKTAYENVLHGYHEQIKPHVAPIQAKVKTQWKQFSKTDIGGKIEKFAYQVHSWIVETFVKVQRFVKQQVDAFNAWWSKDGKKQFGRYVDGFVLGLKMVKNVVVDILTNILAALSHLAVRVKTFFHAWTEGGFNAAMNTLNR